MLVLTPGGSMVKLKNTAHSGVSVGKVHNFLIALSGVKTSLTDIFSDVKHLFS